VVRCHPGRKVFAVLDNVGYHHARLIKDWAEQNKSRIELHFLPAYSPQFNPIEIVWRQAKRAAAHNRHFRHLEELHSKLFRRFNRFQGNPRPLRTIVRNWRLYA
jgi:transposase